MPSFRTRLLGIFLQKKLTIFKRKKTYFYPQIFNLIKRKNKKKKLQWMNSYIRLEKKDYMKLFLIYEKNIRMRNIKTCIRHRRVINEFHLQLVGAPAMLGYYLTLYKYIVHAFRCTSTLSTRTLYNSYVLHAAV